MPGGLKKQTKLWQNPLSVAKTVKFGKEISNQLYKPTILKPTNRIRLENRRAFKYITVLYIVNIFYSFN